MAISFSSLASGKTQKTEIITSTGSWTAPTGVTSVEVILCGGGGAGGGTPGWSGKTTGGAGSVNYSILTVTPGTSYTITIGAGGAGGYGTGGTGGSSSFGALFTINGGPGGVDMWNGEHAVPSGVGLGGGGGSVGYNGTNGWVASAGAPGAYGFGGGGGGGGNQSAPGSSGGGSGRNFSAGISATANSGSGGGGTANSSASSYLGGNGGSGICVIKYWS